MFDFAPSRRMDAGRAVQSYEVRATRDRFLALKTLGCDVLAPSLQFYSDWTLLADDEMLEASAFG